MSDEHRRKFIGAMRSVANSVAVVTTDGPAGRHGATVSSFCSVSADPPSMLVCLHGQSRIATLVKTNACFCVNVLPQELAHVADRFAGRDDASVVDRFDGIGVRDGDHACPCIEDAVSFHCRLVSSNLSGSHGIFIGEVEDVEGAFRRPLTYLDGGYRPWTY